MDKLKQRGKVDEKLYPDEVKSDKWRNFYIDKSGKAYTGTNIWPSEGEALARATEILSEPRLSIKPLMSSIEGEIPKKLISYTIQLPIKD